MPFKSEKQRKWMHANEPEMAKKWEKEEQKEAVQVNVDKVLKNPKIKKLMKRLGIKQAQSYKAAMKILNYLANNPQALSTIKYAFETVKEERDYKAEYKKYGSSTKAKKYRAELNQYNRKKGTYGNGDGKDATHKGGKIVGFEKESTNRGRAEKSRLKKESVNEKKNPKREKVKKDFKTSLKFAKGVIRKIDTFMKSDDWGVVDGFVTNKRTGLASIVKDMEKSMNQIMKMPVDESVNEAASFGAQVLLGGLAAVVKKAGMRPKTAKMMGGGFKVSKRDKVGFKMDVEIRGFDKKKTFKLQFELERGMLYVIIKNKPVKLGKYTMVAHTAQNLKKVGAALIGDK